MIVLVVAVLAALAGVITAGLVVFVLDHLGGSSGWRTYRNDYYGYEVRYPAAWRLADSGRQLKPDESLENQGIRITNGPEEQHRGRVLVFVNFQGGWCDTNHQETSAIELSGITGEEFVCYMPDWAPCSPEPDCRQIPTEVVRYFRGARGRMNYIALGDIPGSSPDLQVEQVRQIASLVQQIVRSFRFTD